MSAGPAAEPGRELLETLARGERRALPALWLAALAGQLLLWLWYWLLAQGVEDWLLGDPAAAAALLPPTLALLPLLALAHLARRQLRERAAGRIASGLFARLLEQLQAQRRALIRRRPLSAWQDFHSRHLPALESYLLDYQLQRWLVATLPLLVCALILPLSWLAALALLLTMPLIPLFMWLVGRGAAALQRRHITALDRLGGLFSDRLLGQQTVRLHGATAAELERFAAASTALNERLAAVLRVAFLSSSVLEFFSTVAVALVAVFTGFALLGEIRIGFYGERPALAEALFILLLAPAFFAELKGLGRLYHVRAEALGAAGAWSQVLDAGPAARAPDLPQFERLTLRNAQLASPGGAVLLGIDGLDLRRGDRVLLQGASGAGKSTLLDALAGQRPLRGDITLNGDRADSLAALRRHTLLLDQEPVLFPGTVADNVGLERHGNAAIAGSLEQVGLGPWLQGLDAGLGTRWDDAPPLSGGQRQRLALARLLLFRPALVLLDEPTAHLDPVERAALNALLLRTLDRCTLVWASHEALPREAFTQHWRIAAGAPPQLRLTDA